MGCVGGAESECAVDLAKALIEKGLAELATQPMDFPTADLSFTSTGQVDFRIMGTDGMTIYVKPTAFDGLYETLTTVGF